MLTFAIVLDMGFSTCLLNLNTIACDKCAWFKVLVLIFGGYMRKKSKAAKNPLKLKNQKGVFLHAKMSWLNRFEQNNKVLGGV